MRIALIASPLHAVPPATHGGVEEQVALHARGLAAEGHDVHVLTVGPEGADESDVARGDALGGATVHRLGRALEDGAEGDAHANRGARRGGLGGLVVAQARFAARARALVRRLAPDIAHYHARYPCLLAPAPADAPATRTLYHAHNWKRAEDMRYAPYSARRAAARAGAVADRRVARRVDHVVAVSAFLRARILRDADLAPARVTHVTNAIDPARFPAVERAGPARALGAAPAPKLVFVGRLAEEKGLLTLLAALPAVLRAAPDASLTVIGPARGGTERGAYQRRCEARVDALGLRAHVRLAGVVPNRALAEHLRTAAALVVPSIWGEPCGVVALEGLATGIPVVASRVGGLAELIRAGRTGLLVPPGDPEALAGALAQALADPALRASAAVEGPRDVRARHTWTAVGTALLAVYERVLADAPTRGADR